MNKDIIKSNALIEAYYKPASLTQMRLLLATLMDVKAGVKLSDKQEFTVSAGALADLTGNAMKQNYRMLVRAAKELRAMYITVNARPNGDERRPVKREINVVGQCDYIEHEGCVKLEFTRQIIPYISALSSHFTSYRAKYVMPMRSAYGIRLYELCLKWLIGFSSKHELTVDEFRKLLGLGNKYKPVKILNRDVVKVAIRNINTHSDLKVKFGQRKAGVRITHFQFVITRKPGMQETPKKKVKKQRKMGWNEFVRLHKAREGIETLAAAKARLKPEYDEYLEQGELSL